MSPGETRQGYQVPVLVTIYQVAASREEAEAQARRALRRVPEVLHIDVGAAVPAQED